MKRTGMLLATSLVLYKRILIIQYRCESFQYLAILFFNSEYINPSYEDLPGVENDRKLLTEFLSDYQQIPIKNADNVLQELQSIIDEKKDEKFERVHFHFSGNYKWDGQE